jgi:hypothetical protein
MKFCKKCKVEKDLSEFGIDKSKKDNLSIYCKDCLKTTREKYKGKYDHKEYYGEYKPKRKEYYQNIKHNKSFYKDNKQKTREIYIQEGILKKQSILESLIKQPIDKKICSKCKNEKEFDEFKKYKKSKDGYYYQCKTCQKESNKKSYEKNKEKLNQKSRDNYQKNKKPKKEKKVNKYPFITSLKSRLNNVNKKFNTKLKLIELLDCSLDDFKINLESQFHDWICWDNYGLNNKKNNYWIIELINKNLNTPQELLHYSNFKIKTFPTIKKPILPKVLTEEQKLKKKLYWKEYRQIHKDRYRINHRIYKNLKKETDPVFKLKERCRTIIGNSIRRNGYTKKSRTHEILGCSYEDFKNHIELQFQTWMNWDNYGLYNGELNYGWDIDHIVPCASAKTEEELLKLNHYTNLRPLCSHINRNIKRDRLNF